MKDFPQLPVIEDLKSHISSSFEISQEKLHDIFVIGTQHLLSTTGSLINAIISIGIKPENIFLTGKIYSTNNETFSLLKKMGVQMFESTLPSEPGHYSDCLENDVRLMWKTLSKSITPNSKIIVLDDGGYTLLNTPDSLLKSNRIIGIEQTTSGARLMEKFAKIPVIMVATCKAKTYLEPAIVAESVKIHLGSVFDSNKEKYFGIVGLGNVGKAIINEFGSKYNFCVFDKNIKQNEFSSNFHVCKTVQELYEISDIIIGITGEDISDTSWLDYSNTDKLLLSLSSGDFEFNRLLRASSMLLENSYLNPLSTLKIRTRNGKLIQILRGGMVANFTGAYDSAPASSIQLTRGLLFSAIIQAIQDNDSNVGMIKLDETLESFCVRQFQNITKRNN